MIAPDTQSGWVSKKNINIEPIRIETAMNSVAALADQTMY